MMPGTVGGPRRICIISHSAYGAMLGGSAGHIGGVERQTSLLACWLADRGHEVTLVTWDEGQEDAIEIGGVRILKLCRRADGLPGLRFFHPRWASLLGALRRADADVYYQNCGEEVTGQVALWCRRRRAGFVFSSASDADCSRQLPYLPTLRERMLYRLGLRFADRIIVQTQTQQHLLSEGFKRQSIVLPMPCPPPHPSEPHRLSWAAPPRILWIGRICPQKRPELLLDLATDCPDLRFDLVGPADVTPYSRAILNRARLLPNVRIHGPVGRQQIAAFYRRAACLCSTSHQEGFPNTFLEAWSQGLPVVSTFDPDDLIARRGLGASVVDPRDLAGAIRGLIAAPDRWTAASSNARDYYLERHAPDRALPLFERVLLEAASVTKNRRSRIASSNARSRVNTCS